MRKSNGLVLLSVLIVLLALFAAAAGVFYQDAGSVRAFTTLRGQTVQIFGQGLFRYDTFLVAAGNRGTDLVVLVFEIPLLVVALVLYRRGSLRGALLLCGSLAYFLYYYASMCFATAYNNLFLVYVVLFSLSFYAFILAVTSVDIQALPARFAGRLPYRGIIVYLYAVGAVLMLVWLGLSLLPALLAGQAPGELASYTSLVTHAIDLAIIVPAAFIAAVSLGRRTPPGYFLAALLILLNLTLGTSLLGQGAAQLLYRVPMAPGQIIGFMGTFAILTLVSIYLTVVLLRDIAEVAPTQAQIAAV